MKRQYNVFGALIFLIAIVALWTYLGTQVTFAIVLLFFAEHEYLDTFYVRKNQKQVL